MRRKQPNIILIFVDNQPADMMGCSGNSEIHTPNLDALAAGGLRFEQAFCANAMCSPCRASVLTGLMPSQHGIHTWLDDYVMDSWPDDWNALAEFDTLPQRLAGAGYDTALIGKYHLGIPESPQNGFRHWVTLGLGHILSFYDNDMNDNGQHYRYPGHSVDFFTDKAIEYLAAQRRADSAPFFMYLTYPAPYGHWPSVKGEPINQFADLYRDMPMHSVPREAVSRELLDWIRVRHEYLPGEEVELYDSLPRLLNDLPTLRNYYSQMSVVDAGVGRVMAELESGGLAEDTIVIYTADHGMSLGLNGFWGHGEDTWPSNTHRQAYNIPLIVSGIDGIAAGSIESSMVGTTDIYGTIVDYAGLEPDAPELSSARSLRPLLSGEVGDWRQAVFMEQEETRSVRTPEWLYMRRFGPSSFDFDDELYDLRSDPEERDNRAADVTCRETMLALGEMVDDFFEKYAEPKWNLWQGGSCKSNSTRPFFWQDVWGEHWAPKF